MQHMKRSNVVLHGFQRLLAATKKEKLDVEGIDWNPTTQQLCETWMQTFVRSDKELCARPNISNIMVRPEGRAVCQLPEEETPSGPSRASPGVSKKFFGQESFRPVKESRSSF
ncbi:hypothetical protein PI126_g18333 [Phytophthora idaei]|nr:hypothetical protein PI126_g18333 [Phytophthora idaei]